MKLYTMLTELFHEFDKMSEDEIRAFAKDWNDELNYRGITQSPKVKMLIDDIINTAIYRARSKNKITA